LRSISHARRSQTRPASGTTCSADFNFALGAGEVAVFVGPSGCGKTTMLKIVAGLDHDYQGRVACPASARVGMVFSGAAAAALAVGR